MLETVRWLLVIEGLTLAVLPLTLWIFRFMPDRGFIFAKILGLLLVTYATWLIGSALPIVASPLVPAVVAIGGGAALWWFGRRQCLAALRTIVRVAVAEEVLFVAAFLIWTVLRAQVFHPAIAHTEQYMDMALLHATLISPSYTPQDPWMSGHGINYYYFGYLLFATATKLAGIAPAIGYNLSLSYLFALVVSGAGSIGFALTQRFRWALAAPFFLGLAGNWHAVLVQLPAHQLPGDPNVSWWFFASTRVVDGDNTINEFPFFSLILGDLHPHVMALPVALLVVALAYNLLMATDGLRLARSPHSLVHLGLASLAVGSLVTINSWDYPTYFLVLAGSIAVKAYISDVNPGWWRTPCWIIAAMAAASLTLFLPFYLHFRSLAHGLGFTHSPHTDPGQFLQVFGILLLPSMLLLATLVYLLRPEEIAPEEKAKDSVVSTGPFNLAERGSVDPVNLWLICAIVGLLLLGALFHLWTLLLILCVAAGAATVLQRVVNTAEPNRADAAALGLILVACFVLGLTEIVYLKDSFDGGSLYRMNTVFKYYYQAWILLGLAAGYGVFRGRVILASYAPRPLALIALGVVAVGAVGGGVYTVLAPLSSIQDYGDRSLDGSAWLSARHPSDAVAINWLRDRAGSQPVTLESDGDAQRGDYNAEVARVSTFAGVPTVMGWPGHEDQWRPGDPGVARRVADVKAIYGTTDSALARRLLRQYHVRYVFVGDTERAEYGAKSIATTKFASFMKVAFRSGTTTIFTW